MSKIFYVQDLYVKFPIKIPVYVHVHASVRQWVVSGGKSRVYCSSVCYSVKHSRMLP